MVIRFISVIHPGSWGNPPGVDLCPYCHVPLNLCLECVQPALRYRICPYFLSLPPRPPIQRTKARYVLSLTVKHCDIPSKITQCNPGPGASALANAACLWAILGIHPWGFLLKQASEDHRRHWLHRGTKERRKQCKIGKLHEIKSKHMTLSHVMIPASIFLGNVKCNLISSVSMNFWVGYRFKIIDKKYLRVNENNLYAVKCCDLRGSA